MYEELKMETNWWSTSFGEEEIEHIARSIRAGCISQGKVTAEFEKKLSEFLEVDHVVAVSNGSSALVIALMAIGIKPGDEVIVPNRTWIATGHAVQLLGAKVVLVDVEPDRPLIDTTQIEEAITVNTKAIIPVHLNGRSAKMRAIMKIAARHNIAVIEDAAQALASRNADGYLGTQSDIGCFSLSVAKTISTGQGGFAVTNNKDLAKRIQSIRTHGIENVKDPKKWLMQGFNFRFTDVLASIGIEQLKRLPERVSYLKELYSIYEEGLQDTAFQLIPVNLELKEVPIYNEFLVKHRTSWIQRLDQTGIETRPLYPDLANASYLNPTSQSFPNSKKYGLKGICLPSGPSQKSEAVRDVIDWIKRHQ